MPSFFSASPASLSAALGSAGAAAAASAASSAASRSAFLVTASSKLFLNSCAPAIWHDCQQLTSAKPSNLKPHHPIWMAHAKAHVGTATPSARDRKFN